ncbi:aldo/keto reductase [Saccharomonospora cyanea]|uniref:Putative oxidoreductase, aryl-alcohol dehydrogenase like protein n=1 Tax=Saccharomonospora cyanea NA-134 TaxID=882082 RepID=H5XDH9_9PSEU|nr:aldo/keto reductase [Saccharomonospora cyanea]EHR60271.1 putative oxidoreductase, aryl-alcohol dehydrogenase like protein [Saccharomonospora cyanea NA-134]
MAERPTLEFPPLSLGAANLGNLYERMTDEQAWAVLETAWERGVRYFDTAPHYGLGLSERRLGAFLATKPRDEFVVSTKVGRLLEPVPDTGELDTAHDFVVPADHRRVWDFSADGVRRGLEDSLNRLGLDSVDVLYLHDPEEGAPGALDTALSSGLDALATLRDEGVVSAVGVGSKSTPALLASARTGVPDLLMVAGRLTLLDQSAAEAVLPECRARGIGVVSAAVFNSGVLTTSEPDESGRYEYGPVPTEVLARARAIAAVCAEFGVDLPTAALRYSLTEPSVRTVVAGSATPAQIRDNADRMAAPVPDGLWKALRDKGLTRL